MSAARAIAYPGTGPQRRRRPLFTQLERQEECIA